MELAVTQYVFLFIADIQQFPFHARRRMETIVPELVVQSALLVINRADCVIRY
jgi:hypothetical protein